MSLFIEQDDRERTDSFALNMRTDLREIRLVSVEARSLARFSEITGPPQISVDFEPERASVAGDSLYVRTKFVLEVVRSDEKGDATTDEIFGFNCIFEAQYDLEEGFAPSQEQIEAFRKGTAVFNSWSFFREFAQNMTVRMGYPAPPVPFLRLVPKSDSTKERPGPPTTKRPASKKSKKRSEDRSQ
jgi:hypothetical protein